MDENTTKESSSTTTTTTTTTTTDNDDSKADKTRPFSYWRVWRAASQLKEHGIASKSKSSQQQYHTTTQQVVTILESWGHKWAGQNEWQSVLNKPSLQHEMEESIIALHHLYDWIVSTKKKKRKREASSEQQPITVVDLCCGKGLFSLLLSYMVGTFWKDDCGITSIVLLDKATAIDWHHIDVANETAVDEKRPALHLWKGVNLHDYDTVLDRLLQLKTLAMVGIHLCKTLSPAAISLVNGLGRTKCPYFLLAPCCLPRVVTSKYITTTTGRQIPIHTYESPTDRADRQRRTAQRDSASGRNRRGLCYLCDQQHRVRNCPTLEGTTKDERSAILKAAALQIPCWNCGLVGHYKADCPNSTAIATIEPPTKKWSVENVLAAPQPFVAYCQVLGESMKEDDGNTAVVLHDTGLENSKTKDHVEQEGNWNQGRKSIYIVSVR